MLEFLLELVEILIEARWKIFFTNVFSTSCKLRFHAVLAKHIIFILMKKSSFINFPCWNFSHHQQESNKNAAD